MIDCPNCECSNQKRNIVEGMGTYPIWKCNTCECLFNDSTIIKKKYSKLNTIRRTLQ